MCSKEPDQWEQVSMKQEKPTIDERVQTKTPTKSACRIPHTDNDRWGRRNMVEGGSQVKEGRPARVQLHRVTYLKLVYQ